MFDPFADFGGLGGGGMGRSGGGGGNVGALRLDLYETQVRPSRREAACEQPPRALAARRVRKSTARVLLVIGITAYFARRTCELTLWG
jgi:hypothetical protein